MSRIPYLLLYAYSNMMTKDADSNRATGEVTDELAQTLLLTSRFMQLIGILRWAVEIGRIDLSLETLSLPHDSGISRRPRHTMLSLLFRSTTTCEDSHTAHIYTMPFGRNSTVTSETNLPPNMPEPRGHLVTISGNYLRFR